MKNPDPDRYNSDFSGFKIPKKSGLEENSEKKADTSRDKINLKCVFR